MKMNSLLLMSAILLMSANGFSQEHSSVVKHVDIIKGEERFAGWLANRGIWNWDNEILVGFVYGHYAKNPTGGHDIDSSKGSDDLFGRSYDGGKPGLLKSV